MRNEDRDPGGYGSARCKLQRRKHGPGIHFALSTVATGLNSDEPAPTPRVNKQLGSDST